MGQGVPRGLCIRSIGEPAPRVLLMCARLPNVRLHGRCCSLALIMLLHLFCPNFMFCPLSGRLRVQLRLSRGGSLLQARSATHALEVTA